MATIYNNIASNKRDSVILITLFILVVTVIGWFIGYVYGEGLSLSLMGFALIFSGVTSFISYYNSDKIVLAATGARELKREESEYVHDIVENLSIGAGLPKPRVYIIDSPALNAFATGRDPQHAVITVTTGIVQNLERLELEGVIAHELAHVGNYDIRFMSLVTVLVGSLTLLANFFTRGSFFGRDSKRGGNIFLVVGLLLLILSPIIATLIKLAISRKREYLADSTGALLTRYPEGLARALEKISADSNQLQIASGATAHMFISNPFKKSSLSNLFNTHPPVEERIRRLRQM